MDLSFDIVVLGCSDEQDAVAGEMVKVAPDISGDKNAKFRAVEVYQRLMYSIGDPYVAWTLNRKNDLSTRTMGMSTTALAFWYMGNPKHPFYMERDVIVALGEE